MKKEKNIQIADKMIHIRFPKDLYDKLKDLAENENRTISNTLLTIVKKNLEKDKKQLAI